MEQVASWSSVKMRPQFDEVGKRLRVVWDLLYLEICISISGKNKGIKRMIWWLYS